ncbi:MAG: hypothetical protein QXZ06_07005, partial [Candidatus Jordarchaeales archaeon]
RDRLARMLKMLVNLGLIEAKIMQPPRRRKSPVKIYETNECGARALKRIQAASEKQEPPGQANP